MWFLAILPLPFRQNFHPKFEFPPKTRKENLSNFLSLSKTSLTLSVLSLKPSLTLSTFSLTLSALSETLIPNWGSTNLSLKPKSPIGGRPIPHNSTNSSFPNPQNSRILSKTQDMCWRMHPLEFSRSIKALENAQDAVVEAAGQNAASQFVKPQPTTVAASQQQRRTPATVSAGSRLSVYAQCICKD